MNKKGEINGVGGFLIMFIGIIVALTLISGGITKNVANVVNTETVVNASVTLPANTSSLTLSGQAVSSVILINETGGDGTVVPASNYTVTNYDVSTGTIRAKLVTNGNTPWQGQKVNISYVYEPLGYAKEASTRAITSLILVFAALGVISFVLWKIYNDGLLSAFE